MYELISRHNFTKALRRFAAALLEKACNHKKRNVPLLEASEGAHAAYLRDE